MLSFYLILIASLYLEPLSDMTCSVSAQMPSCIYLGTAPASTSISSLSGNSIHWGYPKPIQTYHHPSLGLPVSIQSWLQPKLPSPKTSYSTTSLLLNPRSCFVSSEMSWFFFFFFFSKAGKNRTPLVKKREKQESGMVLTNDSLWPREKMPKHNVLRNREELGEVFLV